MTTIKLKNGSGAPLAGDLVQGEPALDLTNKRLYTENSSGTVIEVGTNPTSLTTGTFTSTGIDDNAASTAITIDGSQNVGIGTSSPAYNAHIKQSASYGFGVESPSDDSRLLFGNVSSSWRIAATYDTGGSFQPITFFTSDTERMRIDANGNVGIGATTIDQHLHVEGAGTQAIKVETTADDYAIMQYKTSTSSLWQSFASPTNDYRIGISGTGDAITIDSSLNVGIGTSPSDILHIKDTSSTNVIIDAPTDNATLTLQCGSSDAGAEGAFVQFIQNTTPKWQMGMNTDNTFRWYNYNTSSEAMRIDASGQLLIGVTSLPSAGSGGAGFRADSNGRRNLYLSTTATTSNDLIIFNNPNGTVGNIIVNGTSTSYNTSSDYRLKENVVPLTGATERVKQLNPSRFNFIADADTTVDGFLAHEVADVVPEAITGTKDAMRDEEYEVTPAVLDDDGNVVTEAVMGTHSVPDYQGIDQSKLVPLLVATIQELEARITALESN